MNLRRRIEDSVNNINKCIWIISIPIIFDVVTLILYRIVYQSSYTPTNKFFMLKLGFLSSPPSISFLLEDFPTILSQNNQNGIFGVANNISAADILLIITIILISSFITSGYLSAINRANNNRTSIKDFFIMGNKLWSKFFILQVFYTIPFVLMVFSKWLVFLSFINVLFLYVRYSFIVDQVDVKENFRRGVNFLFGNLGLTIKIALFYGLILSLLSVGIFLLTRLGTLGIVIDIIIVAYAGTVINKAILEIYREKSIENIEIENTVIIQE